MKKAVLWSLLLGLVFLLPGCAPVEWTSSLFLWVFAFFGLYYIFYPVVFIGFVFLSWLADDVEDHPFLMFLCFGAYFSVLRFSGNIDIVAFAKESVGLFFVGCASYLFIGVCYSIFRLRCVGKEDNAEFLEKKRVFLEKNSNDENVWLDHVSRGYVNEPRYNARKHKMFRWIVLWPWSAFWYVAHDLVIKFVNELIDFLRNVYERVYNYAVREATADFQKAEILKVERENAKREEQR